MSAHYDKFDYPSYWVDREYEHHCELFVLEYFFQKIKCTDVIADIGGGYGRLLPKYLHRAKKIYLTDPSSNLLSIARKKYKDKKIQTIHSKLERLDVKIKKESLDLVIMIRVLHHIEDLDSAFKLVYGLLKRKGYLILEFPNKLHIKSLLGEISKGNFTCFIDILPKDIRSKKTKKLGAINFFNYHPDDVLNRLRDTGFRVVELRSVSNVRNGFLKKVIPLEVLLLVEQIIQNHFSRLKLAPSLFVLVKKL